MKRAWRIRREVLAAPDGQRRWDRAYQELLSWACPGSTAALAGERAGKEGVDAGRDLRTGVDAAAGTGADD